MTEFVKTSLRLPADLMDRLKWECLRRKTNQTAAVIAGLELWLSQGQSEGETTTLAPGHAPPAVATEDSYERAYNKSNRPLHDKLETVLNSGDEMTIRAVVPNIEIFFERLRPATTRRKSGGS